MMNSFLYRGNATLLKRSVALLFVSMFAVVAWAQSFTISHTMTPGTCIADASLKIDVTPTNMPAGTQYQYTLYNLTTGAPGLPVVSADLSYTFRDLTAGTYRVEVLARGTSLAPQVRNSINVTTTYVPITVALDLVNSLNSYSCGSGEIVLTIRHGKGDYEVKIVSGPMRVGEVIPYTKVFPNNWTTETNTYKLEGNNWLPGNYEIEVRDAGCGYVAKYTFPITLINEIQYYNFSNGFYDPAKGCNVHRYNFSTTNLPTDHLKYIQRERLEIAILHPGQSEADLIWQPITQNISHFFAEAKVNGFQLFKDYHHLTKMSLGNRVLPVTAIIRLKQCPQVQRRYPISTSIYSEIVVENKQRYRDLTCEDTSFYYKGEAVNFPLCYPRTYKIYHLEGGVLNFMHTYQQDFEDDVEYFDLLKRLGPLPNGVRRTLVVEASDLNGNSLKDTVAVFFSGEFYVDPDSCYLSYTGRFTRRIYLSSQRSHVCGLKAELYDASGTLLQTDSLVDPSNNVYFRFPKMNYGQTYKVVFVDKATGLKLYEQVVNYPKPQYLKRFVPYIEPSRHNQMDGRIQMTLSGTLGAGSVLTVTSPSNKVVYTKVYPEGYNSDNNSYQVLIDFAPIEMGRYKYQIHNTCDGSDTIAYYDAKAYYVRDFKYELAYDCGTAIFKPSAKVFLGDQEVPASEYRFFVHPNDRRVEEKMLSPGEGLLLSGDGNYVVSVVVTTGFSASSITYQNYIYHLNNRGNRDNYADNMLVDFPVSYVTPSLNIDRARSMSYVCGPNSLGTIILQAQGGVAPYTYELYRTEADRDAGANKLQTFTGPFAQFTYGKIGETYHVLIKDKCGSSFKHAVHLINVTDLSAAYALPSRVCAGDPIQLRLMGPEALKQNTNITWYNPQNARIGTTADLDLPGATAAMSGRYRAEFYLQGCDIKVTNFVDVTVDQAITVNTIPQTESACIGKPVALTGPVPPSGTTMYWEVASLRQLNPYPTGINDTYEYTWEGQRLVGNTNESTHRAVFVRAGVYVVRPVYTNGGCFAEGAPITVNVKACTVPVNPHLMHRPIIDWSRFNSTPTRTI